MKHISFKNIKTLPVQCGWSGFFCVPSFDFSQKRTFVPCQSCNIAWHQWYLVADRSWGKVTYFEFCRRYDEDNTESEAKFFIYVYVDTVPRLSLNFVSGNRKSMIIDSRHLTIYFPVVCVFVDYIFHLQTKMLLIFYILIKIICIWPEIKSMKQVGKRSFIE